MGLGLNLLLFAAKLLAGVLTGAISVTADAFNNLSDAAGSAVTLAGFKLAAQKADQRHPFGHGRMEYLAGLAVSLLMLVGVELGRGSVEKIFRPEPAVLGLLPVCLLGLSILVKLWMGWFYGEMGRRSQSPPWPPPGRTPGPTCWPPRRCWRAWPPPTCSTSSWTAGWGCSWRP